MFYVKLGLSLYSHTKVSLNNIGTNSIVASEQYFSTPESFTNNSFIINNWVTQRRQRFLVSLGLLRLQRVIGERKHVFNVTRVSLKLLNKVTSSRKIYEVAKLVSYNFQQLCLTRTWSWPSGNLSNHSPLLPSGISWAIDPPPPPLWNFQFPPWWGYGYFLEPDILSTSTIKTNHEQ